MKGIIFTAESIRAIQNKRKTMTRRVIKPQPPWFAKIRMYGETPTPFYCVDGNQTEMKPHHKPGDILYVKEAWNNFGTFNHYKAEELIQGSVWKSPMFMPRAAARIFLRVTDVRAERVQEIGLGGCYAEGCPEEHERTPDIWFKDLWNSINAKRGYSWDSNPWVWVIEFEPIDGEG